MYKKNKSKIIKKDLIILCLTDCPPNTYGLNCNMTCSPNCVGEYKSVDGTCWCKDGWSNNNKGVLCNKRERVTVNHFMADFPIGFTKTN